MSITCSCLLLFLLSISLHACNALRHLDALDYKKLQHKSHDYHFSNKVREDHRGGVADEISISKENLGDDVETTHTEDHQESKHDLMNKDKIISSKEIKGKGLANAKLYHQTMKSLVSVSWRVPHKKRGEKQPGFNLDYSPPKTHPPSHN